MKKLLLISLWAFAVLTSCKKDNTNDDASVLALSVNSTIAEATWRVTYFFDDTDKTSNFSGYTFTFNAAGTVTAVKTGSLTANGTWRTGTDDSKAKLYLAFTAPPNFIELTEDWQILERTSTKIKLQHISGGNGGTDYLTLEKN